EDETQFIGEEAGGMEPLGRSRFEPGECLACALGIMGQENVDRIGKEQIPAPGVERIVKKDGAGRKHGRGSRDFCLRRHRLRASSWRWRYRSAAPICGPRSSAGFFCPPQALEASGPPPYIRRRSSDGQIFK